MTPQAIKIIDPENLGTKLKNARIKRGLSLDRATKDTGIPFRYLEALESNNFNDLPGQDYINKNLRIYGKYLGIGWPELRRQSKEIFRLQKRKKLGIEHKYFMVLPHYLKSAVIFLIILGILVFLLWKVEEIFKPPYLKITQPMDGSITYDRQLKVLGQSQKEAEIVINNKPIFVDNNGNFETTIDLQNGLNLIKIIAKKRYSKINTAEVRVLLKEVK